MTEQTSVSQQTAKGRESRIKAETGEKKVGLFGGTFNPIHLGHLRGAEEIKESFGLDKVIFIPVAVPPHKSVERVMHASSRLEMVQLAIRTNPSFSVSDVELRRPGKSYSIDTIRYFKTIHPGPLFLILGADAFLEIETWKEFRNLFSLCHFVVMTRPGSTHGREIRDLPKSLASFFRYDREAETWVHVSGNRLYWKEITFLDISSTKIRELIEREGSIRYLVPEEVEIQIREKGLYRERGSRPSDL